MLNSIPQGSFFVAVFHGNRGIKLTVEVKLLQSRWKMLPILIGVPAPMVCRRQMLPQARHVMQGMRIAAPAGGTADIRL
jgi:hypothetical protein